MRIFDDQRYAELAESRKDAYARVQPFPHVVIDDLLPEALCREILSEFPEPDQIDWIRTQDSTGLKLGTRDLAVLSEMTEYLLKELNSPAALQFLETLTGIDGLIPDPYYEGGGLHQIERGGFLKIHADFNRHRKLRLERRLNLLLYLNSDWKDEYGGHLELWDRSMSHCVQRIAPHFNRCVIFNTTDWSFHGHPDPLKCPEGMTRKSLALYYYTAERPENEKSAAHSTLYQYRPEERERTRSFVYRLRRLSAKVIHKLAYWMELPSVLVRKLAIKVSPPMYSDRFDDSQ